MRGYLRREAQQKALLLKETVSINADLKYSLQLTSSQLRSYSQWILHDPALHTFETTMLSGASAAIDIDTISELVAQSEIDFRRLKSNICALLQQQAQVSIAELLQAFPATQGLGTVVGYITLGSQWGHRSEGTQIISWPSSAKQNTQYAHIPMMYFSQENIHEFY